MRQKLRAGTNCIVLVPKYCQRPPPRPKRIRWLWHTMNGVRAVERDGAPLCGHNRDFAFVLVMELQRSTPFRFPVVQEEDQIHSATQSCLGMVRRVAMEIQPASWRRRVQTGGIAVWIGAEFRRAERVHRVEKFAASRRRLDNGDQFLFSGRVIAVPPRPIGSRKFGCRS